MSQRARLLLLFVAISQGSCGKAISRPSQKRHTHSRHQNARKKYTKKTFTYLGLLGGPIAVCVYIYLTHCSRAKGPYTQNKQQAVPQSKHAQPTDNDQYLWDSGQKPTKNHPTYPKKIGFDNDFRPNKTLQNGFQQPIEPNIPPSDVDLEPTSHKPAEDEPIDNPIYPDDGTSSPLTGDLPEITITIPSWGQQHNRSSIVSQIPTAAPDLSQKVKQIPKAQIQTYQMGSQALIEMPSCESSKVMSEFQDNLPISSTKASKEEQKENVPHYPISPDSSIISTQLSPLINVNAPITPIQFGDLTESICLDHPSQIENNACRPDDPRDGYQEFFADVHFGSSIISSNISKNIQGEDFDHIENFNELSGSFLVVSSSQPKVIKMELIAGHSYLGKATGEKLPTTAHRTQSTRSSSSFEPICH